MLIKQRQMLFGQTVTTCITLDGQKIIDIISTMKEWLESNSQRFDNLRLVEMWDYRVIMNLWVIGWRPITSSI